MAEAQRTIKQVYVVTKEGWLYGSWKKVGDAMPLYPIQAAHYVKSGSLRLATETDTTTRPVRPAPTTSRPTSATRKVGSANDPGTVKVAAPAPNPMPETEPTAMPAAVAPTPATPAKA